ncbi:MAG: class I SAM-dependent methyltransferase, partial [Deltaproteobacteria bacterium]
YIMDLNISIILVFDPLHIGCGRGDLLRYLKKKNLNRVCSLLGLDLLENTSEEGITFIKGDIQETDIQEHYDYVINTATIEHIEDIHLFVDNLIRLCKPSSKIILMTINENGYIYLLARILYKMGIPFAAKRLYYGSKHINHFSLRSLTYLLEMKGLKINEIVHHNYPLSAVDLPPCSKTTAFFCKLGILFLFITGSITKRASSVTVVCEIK